MIADTRRTKSLTFYQTTTSQSKFEIDSSYSGGLSATAIANAGYVATTMTNQFNTQLNGFLDMFAKQRAKDVMTLNLSEPNTTARNRGVYRAWEYEKADILMGGSGTENWTVEEQQEIIKNVDFNEQKNSRSGVRGAEGHHQKNVADHPEHQANPDNIKIYRTRDEHIREGHNGDWHNESDKPMRDKNAMLRETNHKRVFRNEIKGIGIAAAIGVGVGFTIGFAVSLAQSGITPDSVKYALVNGSKSGISSGVQALAGYGIGRTVGAIASNALEGILSNVGLEITENISKMCSMGAIGAITIAVFSAVQFAKLIYKGESLKNATIQVGKQALFSLSLLAVSIAAQGIFGGPAGIIVSVSSGIIFVTYSVADIVHQRHYSEKLKIYMIDKCKPIFE